MINFIGLIDAPTYDNRKSGASAGDAVLFDCEELAITIQVRPVGF